jgi:hypothetical protein
MDILFKAVRRLFVHENDIKRNLQNQWDINRTCHLTRLENLEIVNLRSEWPAYTFSTSVNYISPVLFWIDETHIIAGHCLHLEGSLRWPDWHPSENAFLPVADSEATLFPTRIESMGRHYQAVGDRISQTVQGPWHIPETDDVPKSILKHRNDVPELILVEHAKRIKLGRAEASPFAKLGELFLEAGLWEGRDQAGSSPDELITLLSLCPNLEKLWITVMPLVAQHFESWLIRQAGRLTYVFIENADLAWLPHLTSCACVQLEIDVGDHKDLEYLRNSLRYAANLSRHKKEEDNAPSQIEHLRVHLRGGYAIDPPFDAVEFAEYLWACASENTVLKIRVSQWVSRSIASTNRREYMREVEICFATLQGKVLES